MGRSLLNIAVLTSSRADYGIYLPLLNRLKSDPEVSLKIVAFGSHCDDRFGNTVEAIEQDGFEVAERLQTLPVSDAPVDIAESYAKTVHEFSKVWDKETELDWVIVLGDRFEMAAAVNAGIPFGVRFAHLHAGEKTLGAIDEIYRHQISLVSTLHFVSTEAYAQRVHQLVGHAKSTHVVGALSLEKLKGFIPMSKERFVKEWQIDFSVPAVLMTVHPETVNHRQINAHIEALDKAIPEMLQSHQLIVTLPNADTHGSSLRLFFAKLKANYPNQVTLIENFGNEAYFSCMAYADLMIGNTSSGILEGASFGKYVIDLGSRQQGRVTSPNVTHIPFDEVEIRQAFHALKGRTYSGENVYFQPNPSERIMEVLKSTKL